MRSPFASGQPKSKIAPFPVTENTNGLLRQYLPKNADLSTFSQSQLDAIALRLNQRPHDKPWDFTLLRINPEPVLRRPRETTGLTRIWSSMHALQQIAYTIGRRHSGPERSCRHIGPF
jgi:hypothetical protein